MSHSEIHHLADLVNPWLMAVGALLFAVGYLAGRLERSGSRLAHVRRAVADYAAARNRHQRVMERAAKASVRGPLLEETLAAYGRPREVPPPPPIKTELDEEGQR